MNPAEYELIYHVETEHWWYRNLHAIVGDVFNRFVPQGNGFVLDAGCGTGAVVALLATRYQVVGLDFSPLALSFSRKRTTRPLLRGSIRNLPFLDNSFKAIVSLDVVSHAGAGPPANSIRELARVLRPGGHLVLNLPAYAWLHSPHDEQVQTGYRFTRPCLRELVEAAQLEMIYSTHWNSLLMPAVVAARFAKRIAGSRGSDLDDYKPGLASSTCAALLGMERAFLRLSPIPFGVSILAVMRKPE